MSPPKTEFIIERRTLNTSAHQKLSTEKPGISQSAKSTSKVFITSKNNPNVTMVIGIVRITSTGFTKTLRIANTAATTMAIRKPST